MVSPGLKAYSRDLTAVRDWVRVVVAIASMTLSCLPVSARETRQLADLTIEELLDESVTSVSKREQKLGDVASAIAVLTNEDLLRSGAVSIADALRLVPGMNVASVNANQWAVSARGFNNLYANKLLVLVDGRAVYTPLFAGGYWEVVQPMLEDVDRVEVIRGPGATLWGANAVNGVINIVSRDARETQGGLVYGGAGDGEMTQAGVRYGGAVGEATHYRVYAARQTHAAFFSAEGREASDAWTSWQTGVRIDQELGDANRLTWLSDLSIADIDDASAHGYNASSLGRWTRALASGGELEAQAYFAREHRDEAGRSASMMETIDVEVQHAFAAGERHAVIWGAGYRRVDARVWQTNPSVKIGNADLDLDLFSAFVQDEFKLVPERLTLTTGIKVEHNDFTGFEAQPGVRMVWKPTEHQSVWAAVSRAVRTPSALEDKNVFIMEVGAPLAGPEGGLYVPAATGNGNPDAEVIWTHELGWRADLNRRVSVDVATFYNRYRGVIVVGGEPNFVPGEPLGRAELPFRNLLEMESYGMEATINASVSNHWRLSLSQSWLVVDDKMLEAGVQFDPEHQTVLRSSHDFGRVSLDVQLRRVGSFEVTPDLVTTIAMPGYTEADARLAVRLSDEFEISISGRNLLHRAHYEQGPVVFVATNQVPRRVQAKATWRF